MLGGILLGPSLLGWLAPRLTARLFAPSNLGAVSILAEIGVLLFLFGVGAELPAQSIRQMGRRVLLISNLSVALPFALGLVLALLLFSQLAGPRATGLSFSLFLGVAMSITAFPVLARILTETKMFRTPLGSLAISCAAFDDLTAWFLLAGITLVAEHGSVTGVTLVLRAIALASYVWFMLTVVVSAGDRWRRKAGKRSALAFVALLAFMGLSAFVTESIGVHALFGAFLAGMVLPKEPEFVQFIKQNMDLATAVLLPLFFAVSGLRTNVTLMHGRMWGYFALILGVAILGKMFGSAIAARISGLSWLESFRLGTLLNTRGLVEIVVLNVGYDLGIISRDLFSMMVLMAVVTTLMTAPLLRYIERLEGAEPATSGCV
jgi:K+:H+ antiporter